MEKYKAIVENISSQLTELSNDIPDVVNQFFTLVSAGSDDGVLDKKTKELIAIGIAVANRCDGCIGYHIKTLVDLNVTQQELSEALGVAIFMGGGPSLMYAAKTLGAYKEYQTISNDKN